MLLRLMRVSCNAATASVAAIVDEQRTSQYKTEYWNRNHSEIHLNHQRIDSSGLAGVEQRDLPVFEELESRRPPQLATAMHYQVLLEEQLRPFNILSSNLSTEGRLLSCSSIWYEGENISIHVVGVVGK